MPVQFLGINGCGPARNNAVMAYQMQPGNGDKITDLIPPLPSNWLGGVGFSILPQQNQGNYQFGNVRKLRVTVSRPLSWIENADNQYLAGRVILYLPGTGEVICLSPKIFADITEPVSGIFDTDNLTFDSWVPATSQILVYMELDTFANAGAPAQIAPIDTTLWLTLFNFNPDII